MKRPVVEVVRRRGPRRVEPPSAPLPEAVCAALAAVVEEMRHIPRDCIVDRAELLHWLRRLAGRIEGVGRMRVAGTLARPARVHRTPAALPRPTPRDLAEAVFGKGPSSTKPAERHTVTSRKGKTVPVEVRRARAAGQMELGV